MQRYLARYLTHIHRDIKHIHNGVTQSKTGSIIYSTYIHDISAENRVSVYIPNLYHTTPVYAKLSNYPSIYMSIFPVISILSS